MEVPGDYKILDATYNPSLSRQSYAECGTGSIVLNVINGSSDLRFRILEAPAGVTAPADVVATYNPDNGTYKLAGDNYPAGRYVLSVSDHCVERKVDLSIPAYSELPTFEYENSHAFRPYYNNVEKDSLKTYSCTSPVVYLGLSHSTRTNKQLMDNIENGMYEIGLSLRDRNPRDDQFQPLSKQKQFYAFDISPTKISDIYNSYNLKLVVRLKGCPNTTRVIPLNIKYPSISTSGSPTPYGCGKYTRGYYLYTDYDGLFCYPVTVNLRETANGPIVLSEVFEDAHNSDSKLILDYDKTYYYEVIDGNGKRLLADSFRKNTEIAFASAEASDCGNKYVSVYKFPAFDNCIPYKVQVINNKTQEVVQELTVNDKGYIRTPPLEYGIGYIYKAIKDNHTATFANAESKRPPSFEKSDPYENRRDRGSVMFRFSGLGPQTHFLVLRQNTKEIAKSTYSNTGTTYLPSFSDLYLPPGKYQVDVTTEGCPVFTYEFVFKGFYNRENFSYDSQLTCQGLEITPRGYVTLQQYASPAKTFFRIISGPKGGYAEEFIMPGKKIMLTQEGKYKLGIFSEKTDANSLPRSAIDTLDIDFVRKPLQLASQYTAAYACADGTKKGHIVIKAENGVTPYRYELWNEQNTQAIMGNDGKPLKPLETLPNGSVHFVHGVAGETYHVKIYDSCGNSFSQPITIRDLTLLTIASAAETEVCEGESIRLQALPLENYEWYLPNAKSTDLPFSTEQNPVITNAKVAHSGLYKLRFNPQFCGKGIEGYVKIVVRPCYVPVNPQLMNRVLLK